MYGFYRSFSWISLITLAGLPATIVQGGTSFVTTEPSPTTDPSPIVTPLRTIDLAPIQTPVEIVIGLLFVVFQSCFLSFQSAKSFFLTL